MKFGVNINNAFVITSKGQIIQIPNTSLQLSFCQCHIGTYYKFVPTPIIKREGRLYTPYLRYESLLYVSVCISLINNDLAYVWGRGYILDTQKE